MARIIPRMASNNTALFVCDMQDKFRDTISHMPAVIDTSRRLVKFCKLLNMDICVTEQYPEKLGRTMPEISSQLPPTQQYVSKKDFSMCHDMKNQQEKHVNLLKFNRDQVRNVILVGIEAHVCVMQTTIDLLEAQYNVFVVADGVSSRYLQDRHFALKRMEQMGAYLVTQEMAMFEILAKADHPSFKEASALIKENRLDRIPNYQ